MAITKTHPIKSTLRKAIGYIINSAKTDGKILVSSFACAAETADLEFEMTRRLSAMRGTHLARHLIQSFAVGETTPEQAHEIGMKLAQRVLHGKYEFVLATHIDKGHIHNHIIFNAVSFVDYKKYHSNKYTYRAIRQASDELCAEYGLSVIVPKKRGRNLIIDIKNSAKAAESKSYEHWAKIHNLKLASEAINFLSENGIKTYEELESFAEKAYDNHEKSAREIKDVEKEMAEIAVIIKNIESYRRLKPVYDKYRASRNKRDFMRHHERELKLFKAAATVTGKNNHDLDELKSICSDLKIKKAQLYREYKNLGCRCAQIDTVKQNIDFILSAPPVQKSIEHER